MSIRAGLRGIVASDSFVQGSSCLRSKPNVSGTGRAERVQVRDGSTDGRKQAWRALSNIIYTLLECSKLIEQRRGS